MSHYEIIDAQGNIAESGADAAALFSRLETLNGPRGDRGYTLRRAPNGIPAAPCIPAPAALEVALTAWVADGDARARCTPEGVYRWSADGALTCGTDAIGTAPRTRRGVEVAEGVIAAFERPAPVVVPVVAPVVEVVTPAPAPARVVVAGKTIDPDAAARIARNRAILTESGIALPEAWFAAGTDMLDCGREAFFSMAREFESQVPFVDAARSAIQAITDQRRVDYVVEPGDVRRIRLEDGWLKFDGREARIGMSALRDLLGKYSEVFPAAGRWASVMGKSALEAAVNDGFDRWSRENTDRGVQFRTRRHAITGEPIVWAVVGPQYPGRATDADAILKAMIRQIGNDRAVKGEITVDPNNGRMLARAIWQDTTIKNPAVGDIFRATLVGQTRDDAKGAFRGSGGVTAIRCINCSLAESTWGEGRGIHRSVESVLKAVSGSFDGFRGKADKLLSSWGYMTEADLEVETDDGTVLSGTDAVAAYCAQSDVVLAGWESAGLRADEAEPILLDAVARERDAGRVDGTLADVIRAIAAMAQDRRVDSFARVEIETLSGRLVPILAAAAQEATA